MLKDNLDFKEQDKYRSQLKFIIDSYKQAGRKPARLKIKDFRQVKFGEIVVDSGWGIVVEDEKGSDYYGIMACHLSEDAAGRLKTMAENWMKACLSGHTAKNRKNRKA